MPNRLGQNQKRLVVVWAVTFLGLAGGTYFFFVRTSDAFQNLERLDVSTYVESAKAFQGGTFYVEGTMDELLRADSTKGRLVSLAVATPRGVVLIPVMVPHGLGSFNLQKGQILKLKVKGIGSGLLQAEMIAKTK